MEQSFENVEKLAQELFRETAVLSSAEQGISRPAYSEIETGVLEYLAQIAQQYGIHVWQDPCNNYLFCLPEDKNAERYALAGSHIDSVNHGGNYDGLAGIIAGLLCLIQAKQDGQQFTVPVHVIALRGEESHWFGPCYIGSKCLTGQLKPFELAAQHRGDGRTLESYLRDFDIDVDQVREGKPFIDINLLHEYIELHIEQGPMLIGKRLPAAIVSGIRGNFRYKNIVCVGEPGHSGAVPRAYRRDPVMAFADLISRLDESWLTILQKGNDLVLTSGMVGTDPEKHSLSRIPDQISFSLDCRSQSVSVLNEMQELLQLEINQIEKKRKVHFHLGKKISTNPAMMSEKIINGLQKAMQQTGIEPFVMPSGAGHDAAVFAHAGVPSGMIFVRNQHGSHNPDEAMELSDFLLGSKIMYNYFTREK